MYMAATMRPDLYPYAAYKPSGVPWLGDMPAHWEVRRLKAVCQLAYGDSLPADARGDGVVPVFGSNGPVGMHMKANTEAPCIVVGRKGSFGKVHYSTQPVFAIDTTYYVDERNSTANLAWLSRVLGWLQLDAVSRDSTIPGLNREEAYDRLLPLPPPPRTSRHRPLPGPRRPAHPAVRHRQAEAHRAARGGAAGCRQPGRHPRPRPQRPPQALRRRVARRRAGALGNAERQAAIQSPPRISQAK